METIFLFIALTAAGDLHEKLSGCASDMWAMSRNLTVMSDKRLEQCAFHLEEAALRLKEQNK